MERRKPLFVVFSLMRVFLCNFNCKLLYIHKLVSHSANAINSHVRFATIETFCQTNTRSFTENEKFIVLPYHQVIIDLNLSDCVILKRYKSIGDVLDL